MRHTIISVTADIDILTEDPRWGSIGLEALAFTACQSALVQAGIGGDIEISILAADDTRIATLNSDFRGKDGATNVLSWPAEDLSADADGGIPSPPNMPEIGDIALAYDTVAKEAEGQGLAMSDHVTHLIVHGVLHLLGYDHQTDADAARMEGLEIKALETLSIENPYLD